ncbi:hypothetical protein D9758_007638 [Tetrapyrgos nigripes]|uniref:RRM domain-containing protein n=1 Tax=Tetrapyrgos nigripes TaxID=182062 RepID=A0A8H5LK44_9AGAR|nr:hypothetical protein D9758_007638 [Tetrapyrgos nigripes]
MFSNALRASIRHTLAATKPSRLTPSRLTRASNPSIVTAALSCALRRTFSASHVATQEKRVVRVHNLPFDAQEEDLKKAVEEFGPVKGVFITRKSGRDSAYRTSAEIFFESSEHASACFTRLSTAEEPVLFDVRKLKPVLTEVSRLDSDTLYVEDLPSGVQPGDLRRVFSPFGEVKFVSTGKQNQAYVQFSDKETADRILEAHQKDPIMLDNKTLTIDKGHVWQEGEPSKELYFSNFPGTKSEMQDLIDRSGLKVEDLRLLRQRRNYYRNGFIALKSVEDATAMMQFLTKERDGLRVGFALNHPKEKKLKTNAATSGDAQTQVAA